MNRSKALLIAGIATVLMVFLSAYMSAQQASPFIATPPPPKTYPSWKVIGSQDMKTYTVNDPNNELTCHLATLPGSGLTSLGFVLVCMEKSKVTITVPPNATPAR